MSDAFLQHLFVNVSQKTIVHCFKVH